MGLDTFAVYGVNHPKYVEDNDAIPSSLFEGIHLFGSMFTDGGNSFRGKCYDDWVEFATGESLYEETIPPDLVSDMTDLLEANTNEAEFNLFNTHNGNYWQLTFDDVQNVLKWFRVVRNEGGTIINWW